MENVLKVENLKIGIKNKNKTVYPVENVNLIKDKKEFEKDRCKKRCYNCAR